MRYNALSFELPLLLKKFVNPHSYSRSNFRKNTRMPPPMIPAVRVPLISPLLNAGLGPELTWSVKPTRNDSETPARISTFIGDESKIFAPTCKGTLI